MFQIWFHYRLEPLFYFQHIPQLFNRECLADSKLSLIPCISSAIKFEETTLHSTFFKQYKEFKRSSIMFEQLNILAEIRDSNNIFICVNIV